MGGPNGLAARGWSLATCEETRVPILRKEWVCDDFYEGEKRVSVGGVLGWGAGLREEGCFLWGGAVVRSTPLDPAPPQNKRLHTIHTQRWS